MSIQWNVSFKPALLRDVTALPPKEMHQVMAKINLLIEDPEPDAKVKKFLKYLSGDGQRLYRLRSGDYRIFYTFSSEKHSLSLLAIKRRADDTYDDALDAELLEGLDVELDGSSAPAQPDWNKIFAQQQEDRPLPEPMTVELLTRLRVPEVYHTRLLGVQTQNELLACPGVDDTTLLELDEYLFERPLIQVMQQPDLALSEVDDLLRYKEGELISFLLKLSPEQEKYVHWSLSLSGPTLIKGGPGTGKSTIALYRVRSMLDQLRKAGKSAPRVLFTTYTNALLHASEQLLEQLLGREARQQCVQVQTADSLASKILYERKAFKEIIAPTELSQLTRRAIKETPLAGNLLQQEAQRQTLERMGLDYLLQEINTIIVARQLASLNDYLAAPRNGRKLRLNASQRGLIWRVYERWRELLLASGQETWQQRRARAADLVEQSTLYQSYDAVVIDEAQDLDPSALRLLVQMCKAPNRLFVAADANQSIYGSGFTWTNVHQHLRFQGRTSVLHINYRSTAEIGEAAQAYLVDGALEPEELERQYINNGPLPDVRSVLNSEHEAQLLASFFRKACASLRVALGSCAVLCPSERTGRGIAQALMSQGLEAAYMTSQNLDLKRTGIKVITLNASKGLEFPIVALAGFVSGGYPVIPPGASADERAESLARERRTMYVAMTRAMRALLVVLPAEPESPLFQGFDELCWNFTRPI